MLSVGDKFIRGSRERTIVLMNHAGFYWKETDKKDNYSTLDIRYPSDDCFNDRYQTFIDAHIKKGWTYIPIEEEEVL